MTPLSFQLASDLLNFCQLTVRNIIKRSKYDDTKTLYDLTSNNDNEKAVQNSYNNAVQNEI